MTKKILFVLTSHDQLGDTGQTTGAYAPEFAIPARVFEQAGREFDVVSVAGGKPPIVGIEDDDTATLEFLARPDIASKLEDAAAPEQVSAGDYDAIFFVGGHGTMWDFPDNSALAELALRISDNGGVVAAVCHGPAALVGLRSADGQYLVDGKRVSSFTNEEEEAIGATNTVPFLLEDALISRGARHEKGPNFQEYAVADGRLITGQNPASGAKVAELTLGQLAQR